MVWGLFPAHPPSGDQKYYICANGTYKVGRKGCDMTIRNDKGISRIHAEIIVDAIESFDLIENRLPNFSSNVRIRDLSKYGTCIDRNGMKEKVLDCPNKETYLRHGDLVTFGAGNVMYRFSFVPLIFYLCNFTSSQATPSTQDKVSSIGACVTHNWTTECTHVIVDPFMPVTEELIDIILHKKPLVLSTWLEFVAAARIHNEIPSYSQYVPTLTLDDRSLTVADTRTRESSLKGYTFLLDSATMYRFQSRVQSLLVVAGAKVLSVEEFDLNSQDLETYNFVVLVIPAEKAEHFSPNSFLSKITEIDLISAIISGHLDPSMLISPSIVVSSSCSTDETVVADSDKEIETATSNHQTMTNAVLGNTGDEGERQTFKKHAGSMTEDALSANLMRLNYTKIIRGEEATEFKSKEAKFVNQDASSLGDGKVVSFLEPNRVATTIKNDDLESPNVDIFYSEKLIVRGSNGRESSGCATDSGVINFKRFRKTNTQSGNSFTNLVPFSKYAYSDSDYNKEVNECVKEEKRRKQMEALAEDLFNNEKGRRRGAAGSIFGLLSRS